MNCCLVKTFGICEHIYTQMTSIRVCPAPNWVIKSQCSTSCFSCWAADSTHRVKNPECVLAILLKFNGFQNVQLVVGHAVAFLCEQGHSFKNLFTSNCNSSLLTPTQLTTTIDGVYQLIFISSLKIPALSIFNHLFVLKALSVVGPKCRDSLPQTDQFLPAWNVNFLSKPNNFFLSINSTLWKYPGALWCLLF